MQSNREVFSIVPLPACIKNRKGSLKTMPFLFFNKCIMCYNTSDGAEYTRAPSSLLSIYKLRASSP